MDKIYNNACFPEKIRCQGSIEDLKKYFMETAASLHNREENDFLSSKENESDCK